MMTYTPGPSFSASETHDLKGRRDDVRTRERERER